ncbi:bifunctional diaminohydroxyphosphoribosylaminopyrimidine deaminase/5-amino-6-(5-phosphoribosylamino)uracil reductase RibD [Palleronia sediminis]|nr:bifunctional diaminohydroxyphosphoribosylaminopyrimidine deaminase/5-amino-6-(5-phosphoribosylamino)uracil reductase RibD [Palleronia sediminis]
MSGQDDARHMAHALALGRRGLGRVWPNPAVGCVIVHDGRIIGRGWTADGGRPHAETRALQQAGAAARGATAHVTLEPCAHHGRTPPCAEALIRAGVARVVTALEDPDPRVSGKGHAMLRAAGVEVATGCGAAIARRDQAGFLSRVTRGRPMLTLKLAATLDGRIATASGESRWITGPAARMRVHAMRASHDAVLVGGGTARADDPALTLRGFGDAPQPVRVVAARKLDLDPQGRLGTGVAPTWLCHGAEAPADRRAAWAAKGARLIELPVRGGQLDPVAMLEALGAAGLTRVLCEGGASFAAALIQADLVDRLALFSAGIAMGAEGLPALGALGLGRLADAPRFRLASVEQVGPDTLSQWDRA